MTPSEIPSKDLILMAIKKGSLPRFLYKYRAESLDKDGKLENKNTQKIITENELWFSPPAEFNDPYDCNTTITSDTTLDDLNIWLERVGLAKVMSLEKAVSLVNSNKDKFIQDVIRGINHFWICCFSKIDNSILQWSHYSNYHKGICFGFDITQNPEYFEMLINVSYSKEMRPYNHFKNSKRIVLDVIGAKFIDWSYESEVRVVKYPDMIRDNGNSKAFKFKDTALCEVIFGTNTPKEIIEFYITLCMNHNKSHVKFYKMVLSSGTCYGLDKHGIRVINNGGLYTFEVL